MPTASKLTDPFFAKLITDLSANNTLFFTPRQLYYLLDKRLRSRAAQDGLAVNLISYISGGIFIVLVGSILAQAFVRLTFDLSLPIFIILYTAWAIWKVAHDSIDRQFNRRIRQNNIQTLKVMAIMILVIGLPLSIIAKTVVGIVGSIGLGIGAAALYLNRKRQQHKIFDEFFIEQSQFETWLDRWTRINNVPEKILPPPQTASLPVAPNPEVTAYSFDRVVVCDQPTIAHLLISNNFHFENNCAILTIDGYPQSIFTTTMKMLRRNPELKVYALHNCSPSGIKLIRRLREEETWFPNPEIPIIDVGILPRQIMENIDVMTPQSSSSAQTAQQLAPDVRASLNPDELAWLDAGCYLELESFPPQKLIQILQRAINESRELAVVEGGDMVIMGSSLGFYTVDSFG